MEVLSLVSDLLSPVVACLAETDSTFKGRSQTSLFIKFRVSSEGLFSDLLGRLSFHLLVLPHLKCSWV